MIPSATVTHILNLVLAIVWDNIWHCNLSHHNTIIPTNVPSMCNTSLHEISQLRDIWHLRSAHTIRVTSYLNRSSPLTIPEAHATYGQRSSANDEQKLFSSCFARIGNTRILFPAFGWHLVSCDRHLVSCDRHLVSWTSWADRAFEIIYIKVIIGIVSFLGNYIFIHYFLFRIPRCKNFYALGNLTTI